MVDANVVRVHKEDREDKRCLRGEYAPQTGVCRVCSGKVIAEISFRRDGRRGGPPQPAYVAGWHCEDCRLVYRGCPPPKP